MGAFNHILNDLSIVVNQFESLSRFSAGIDRLSVFLTAMREADPERDAQSSLLALPRSSQASNSTTAASDSLVLMDSIFDLGRSMLSGTIEIRRLDDEHLVVADGEYRRPSATPILSLQNLDLCTPDRKRSLIEDLSIELMEGENLLIVGASGAGKSRYERRCKS